MFLQMHDGSVAHVSVGGPTHRIKVRGQIITFEDHPQCGPTPVNAKTGAELKLAEKHPFWEAATRWYECGKVVADGVAQWSPAPPVTLGMVKWGREWFQIAIAERMLWELNEPLRSALQAEIDDAKAKEWACSTS